MAERAHKTFIDLCRNGQASVAEIDDYIEGLHIEPSEGELHEYLGMSWEEYATWVADPAVLLPSF